MQKNVFNNVGIVFLLLLLFIGTSCENEDSNNPVVRSFNKEYLVNQVQKVSQHYAGQSFSKANHEVNILSYTQGRKNCKGLFVVESRNSEKLQVPLCQNRTSSELNTINELSALLMHSLLTSDYSCLNLDSFEFLLTQLSMDGSGLYYSNTADVDIKTKRGNSIISARENGLLFNAIANFLNSDELDASSYQRFKIIYEKMALSLVSVQHEDGFWRSNMADFFHYPMPESSSTAHFVSGLAIGIQLNILQEKRYAASVVRGWAALSQSIDANGTVGWVQPLGVSCGPSHPKSTNLSVVGPFLSAAANVYRLLDDKVLKKKNIEQLLGESQRMLPAKAIEGDFGADNHPLFKELNAFAISEIPTDFAATGLRKKDYLDIIAGQVKVMQNYQNDEGRIIDPVEKVEKYFTTACYAHSVAVLAQAAYPIGEQLVESGMKALDVAVKDMKLARAPGGHGDFFTWPMTLAFEAFEGIATTERYENWKMQLSLLNPEKSYNVYRKPISDDDVDGLLTNYRPGFANNWNLVNTAGEWARGQQVETDPWYVDYCMTMQLANFTPFGMYNEHGNPLPYDLFARHYLTGILHLGYESHLHTTYRDVLWRGAWTSLFMQSPFGELPTGYRSSHHLWNEAEQAVIFEIYANAYAAAGKPKEAGAFKRAAHLSLFSIKQWIRPDGTGCIVKNHYPIEAKHGYEHYSMHSCYNMLTTSMLAQAYQFANEEIEELPCPADVGGFAFEVPEFHKVFANSNGNYLEYDTRGDQEYNPTGLVRVHLKNSYPQLGPSDGCASKYSGKGNVYAVGPEWKNEDGKWSRLAMKKDQKTLFNHVSISKEKVLFELIHKVNPTDESEILTEIFSIDASGVVVTNEITGLENSALRVSLPLLVFDGKNKTDVTVSASDISLSLNEKSINYKLQKTSDERIVREGFELKHRNGIVELFWLESSKKKLTYSIEAN